MDIFIDKLGFIVSDNDGYEVKLSKNLKLADTGARGRKWTRELGS